MNVSYRWLKALAPELDTAPEELAARLASLGFPVEGMERLSGGLEDLVVARVAEVRPHPNADRLVVCDVDGGGEPLQVVCGAPNVKPGGWYPFAPVGSSLPGGMKIGKAKLRGEVSEGMLCSEHEVGLGRDESGLMELEGTFTPGQSLVEALGLDDVRLDVEVTSNRPDLLSHRGVAREVAPGGHGGLRLPAVPGETAGTAEALDALDVVRDGREVSGDGVTIRIEDADRCGAYLGLVVHGVKVGPSPGWLRTRLRAAGARPINNVVDATNYVLLELGHPLHAFDLARLEEGTIVVRTARDGEAIRTLDGVARNLTPEMLTISDARRPVAVAGVMGGEDSEVGEGTADVLLECALFTPGPVRATRKALGLSTDASYRFERGVDPEGLREAILRTARIILATAGGRVTGPLLEVRPRPFEADLVRIRPSRVEEVLGVAFSPQRIWELLEPLGFQTDGGLERSSGPDGDGAGGSDALLVRVPGFRSWDVTREVDLIEEVARTHGYDAFPDTLHPYRPGTVPDHPLFVLEDRLRRELVGAGLLEAHTLAFAPEGEGDVEILNPVSFEERFLRRSLVPGLVRRVGYNLARGNRDVRLFEVGTVFRRGSAGDLPREDTHLALALHGRRHPRHWTHGADPLDVWDLKGLLEAVGGTASGGRWSVEPASGHPDDPISGPFDPAAAFVVTDEEGQIRGRGGRVRPDRLDLPRWAGDVWVAELRLPPEPVDGAAVRYEPLPTHPGVDRDLALLVDRSRTSRELLGLIRDHAGPLLQELEVFDVYEGEGVPAGMRSVAVRLHFQAGSRTLTDADVDEAVERAVKALQDNLGVDVRGRED